MWCRGRETLDLADPVSPSVARLTENPLLGGGRGVVDGDVACVLKGSSLSLMSIKDPLSVELGGVLGGRFLYVSRADRVLEIIDVSDPTSLQVVSRVELPVQAPFHAEDIAVDGSYAYMVCRSNPVLIIVDVRDAQAPHFVAKQPLSRAGHALTLAGDFAY